MNQAAPTRTLRIASIAVQVAPQEVRAVLLAFACYFVLLGSFYILRPVRDAMATVFGVDELQNLFTGTLLFTLIAAPLYAWAATRMRLSLLLPGVFGLWVVNVLIFYVLFNQAPHNRWVAAAYYWWFSVVNLFMISVFWSLMVDVFSARQAQRLFGFIAAGGSLGGIAGPLTTRLFVNAIGPDGMLLVAAAGLVLIIVLVCLLIREKERLRTHDDEAQQTTLDHGLGGGSFDGFKALFKSSYMLNQALFMMLMTWVATVGYYIQTELVTAAFSDLARRTQALADIDLVVNVCSAAVLIFGLGRFVTRFGVTASLVLNPIIMVVVFIGMAVSPSWLMLQAMQITRRVSQYAIARPSREICFTVLEQKHRYKAKSVLDTVVYRFGDLTAAWIQSGLRQAGFGLQGATWLGLMSSAAWGVVAVAMGRRYEVLRAQQETTASHAPRNAGVILPADN